jgi:hypothetical protein
MVSWVTLVTITIVLVLGSCVEVVVFLFTTVTFDCSWVDSELVTSVDSSTVVVLFLPESSVTVTTVTWVFVQVFSEDPSWVSVEELLVWVWVVWVVVLVAFSSVVFSGWGWRGTEVDSSVLLEIVS